MNTKRSPADDETMTSRKQFLVVGMALTLLFLAGQVSMHWLAQFAL